MFLRTQTRQSKYLSASIETGDEQLQNVCFYTSHGLVDRQSSGDGSLLGTGLNDLLAVEAVHVQHVVEDITQLVQVDTARAAHDADVDAQNLRQLLDRFCRN